MAETEKEVEALILTLTQLKPLAGTSGSDDAENNHERAKNRAFVGLFYFD